MRGQLLEAGIHKVAVRVFVEAQVEAVGQQVLGADFHLAHVHTPAQIKVFVEHIAVAVFFGRPVSYPFAPGIASVLVDAAHAHQPAFVGRQSLFSDHIADEHDPEIVFQFACFASQGADLFGEIIGFRIGQEIGRLPDFFNGDEVFVHEAGDVCFHRQHHFLANR